MTDIPLIDKEDVIKLKRPKNDGIVIDDIYKEQYNISEKILDRLTINTPKIGIGKEKSYMLPNGIAVMVDYSSWYPEHKLFWHGVDKVKCEKYTNKYDKFYVVLKCQFLGIFPIPGNIFIEWFKNFKLSDGLWNFKIVHEGQKSLIKDLNVDISEYRNRIDMLEDKENTVGELKDKFPENDKNKKIEKIMATDSLSDITKDEKILLQDYIARNKIKLRSKKFGNGYDKDSEIYLPSEENPLVHKEKVLVIDMSNDAWKKKLGTDHNKTEIHGMTDIVRLHKKEKYDNHIWSVLGDRFFTTNDDIGSCVIKDADICDYPIVLIDYEYSWKKEKSYVETTQKSTEKIIEEQVHVREDQIIIPITRENREIELANGIYATICMLVYQISKTMFDNIYISLKTSQIIILGGTNGIGKNKIIELIARLVSKNFKDQFYVMPVGPEFHDSKTILVKYNAAKDKYEPTPLLEMLSRALKYIDEHHFFIFDEGNIAHPEQYAAAILSAIETLKELPLPAGYTIETKYGVYKDKIRIPKNISFIFTMNMDETTHKLAPKTIDRAIFIDMSEIDTEEFFDLIVKTENFLTYEEVEGKFADMFKKYFIDDEIRKYERAEIVRTKIFRDYIIKNRSKFIFFKNINEKLKGKSLRGFAAYRMVVDTVCYMIFREKLDSKDLSEDIAMDFIMIQKILPMIKPNEGSGDVLKFLREFSEENDCSMSVEKIDRMTKGLNENDFTEFCR